MMNDNGKTAAAEALISKCKKLGATDVEVVLGGSADTSVTCRNGDLENIERSENYALGLRVFVGKQTAVVSSSKFDKMDELAERAVSMAKQAPMDEFVALAPEELLAREAVNLDLYDKEIPSEEKLINLANEVEAAALAHEGVTNSEGGDANFSEFYTTLLTSKGFSGSNRSTYCGFSVRVLAGRGTEMQRDYDYSAARFFSDLEPVTKIGDSAAKRVLAKLNARNVKSGKFSVVFDPRISRNFLSDLATGINGAAVARGTSFLKNKLGEKIFAGGINIIDDPHIRRGHGSRPFDSEGVKNGKLNIIENGVLTTWLLDVRSANQLRLVTNGRASRAIGSLPSPSTTNLYMEKGQQSPDELIKSVKAGLYITETFGMGINYVTGDYSQGAGGFWIENGEIAYPVNEITIADNLCDIFAKTIPANDLEFKYSVNAPTLLVPEMTIAGK